MAHSNYKVLTNADLSSNEIYNVSRIVNTEEDSKALSIETKGNTSLKAANLAGTVDGETALTTNTSNVTVTGTATETITTSKTTTVETASTATKTTEKIDAEGISINTPSQKVTATGSTKTISPSIVAITEEVEDEVASKGSYSKIELDKTGATATITAKKYTVDADVAEGSITQTAPTSTYKTSDNNRILLDRNGIEIKNNSEIVKLGSSKTSISGTELKVTTTNVNVDNTRTNITSTGGIAVKTSDTSKLEVLSTGTDLTTPKVTVHGTGAEGVLIKSDPSSVSVKDATVSIASGGSLELSAETGTNIDDDSFVSVSAPTINETATNGSITDTAATINLTTSRTSGDNSGASTLTIDGNAATLSTTTGKVIATNLTQTAPTSTYEADNKNKIELTTSSVKVSSGTENVTIAESTSTTVNSKNFTVSAPAVKVEGNATTSITSNNSITAKATNSTGTTTVTAKPAELSIDSNKVTITGKGTGEAIKLAATNATEDTTDDTTALN